MKFNAVISALVAISLTAAGPAFGTPADGRPFKDSDGRVIDPANYPDGGYGGQRPQRERRGDMKPFTDSDGRVIDPRNYPDGGYGRGYRGDRRDGVRGAGPDHRFYRGDRLPPEYRHRNYVIEDWRGHHLSAPPRGYQWVQSGGDYLLVAIATGVILQILLNN
ncbi:MAG TPA: RcnB family protein [Ramlibacter sp.]|nr:RcnB family protein [Ramlibacter sp.]